jgi:hypothetical protein
MQRRNAFGKANNFQTPVPPAAARAEMTWWLAGGRGCATPTNCMNSRKPNNSEVRADQVASIKIQTLKLGLDVQADSIVVLAARELPPLGGKPDAPDARDGKKLFGTRRSVRGILGA